MNSIFQFSSIYQTEIIEISMTSTRILWQRSNSPNPKHLTWLYLHILNRKDKARNSNWLPNFKWTIEWRKRGAEKDEWKKRQKEFRCYILKGKFLSHFTNSSVIKSLNSGKLTNTLLCAKSLTGSSKRKRINFLNKKWSIKFYPHIHKQQQILCSARPQRKL